METQDLAAFLAIVERGSFSAAAEALHLTQPAVSRRVAALERRLAVRLFDRIGRTVALTEAGRALLPRARRVLDELDDARRSIRELDGAVAGRLHLGTSHHMGLHRLPPVLRSFTQRFPEVELDLRFMDSEAAHELLAHGHLELAVVTLAPGGVPGLEHGTVWDDPLGFAVGPEDPLARAGTVTLAALSERPAVLPGPSTYTGRIVTGAFADAELALDAVLETNYLETVRMMAHVGLGWTVLPETMIDERLVPLRVTDAPVLRRTLGWVRHPERTPSNAARAFLGLLAEHGDASDAPGAG